MSRLVLEQTLAGNTPLFSPFFLLGDPTPEISFQILSACLRAGAPMLELGFAYSDPVADGPALQRAAIRTRAGGTTVDGAFRLLSRLRSVSDAPFNLLVYGNLLHARGAKRFCRDAADAGASSLLVPDCPLEENERLAETASAAGLAFCDLVGPATSAERLRRIGTRVTGFIYRTGRQGVTGRGGSADALADVAATVSATPHPVCVGFGIETHEQLEAVWGAGARIAVIGSALARRIAAVEHCLTDPASVNTLIEGMASRVRAAVDASQRAKGD
ncbi:MAG TPA: tryptophan synthase subunit alpha [Planctomycetes bacterium]|nr:tryptophan synthase subunit alpha [Planctomycetota bacterium]